jgi:inner membrane transporter RhtA
VDATGRVDARTRSVLGGVATMTASAASNQVGAATGAHAFASIGPAGVVAVRQFVAAAVLLPVARPDPRRFTWAQWWPTLLLGLVFATMNLSLYTAIDRIGLGLAVTLEFLGPLSVALAGSRTRLDLLCAVGAGAGVYVLVLPGPSSDYLGVGLGLLAAGCWAAYILLNRMLGGRLPGLQAPAAATAVAVLLYLPVAVFLAASGRLTAAGVGYAVGAGLLSSAVPYAADLIVLRRVPPRFFGVMMSIHPVLAALAGLALLAQVPRAHEWLGIAMVVTVNAVAVAGAPGLRQPCLGQVGDDDHPLVVGGERPAVLAVPVDGGEPRGEQPVAQFGEAEQPLDEGELPGPAVTHDRTGRLEPPGQRVQVVPVDEQVFAARHGHPGRRVRGEERGEVVQVHGEPAARPQGAGDPVQNRPVGGVVEVSERGRPVDHAIEAPRPR